MNIQIIEKSLLPLFLATIIVVAFNWQFVHIYPYLIEKFTNDKLLVLYSHLFIYTFLSLTITVFLVNILHYFLIQSKTFVVISIIMLLSFYLFSFNTLGDIFNYFIAYPFSTNAIMGMVLFSVGSISYAFYTLVNIFIKGVIPLSHSLTFIALAIGYSVLFINYYCYPISKIMTKV